MRGRHLIGFGLAGLLALFGPVGAAGPVAASSGPVGEAERGAPAGSARAAEGSGGPSGKTVTGHARATLHDRWTDTARAASPPTRADPQEVVRTVTLVTGDRVRLEYGAEGGPRVNVTPAPGREDIAIRVRRDGAEVSVVPADAKPLLAAGRVDPRLFDVTGLVRQGYHDGATNRLPLLVQYEPFAARPAPVNPLGAGVAARADAGALGRPSGPRLLHGVRMAAIEPAKRELRGFWRSWPGSGPEGSDASGGQSDRAAGSNGAQGPATMATRAAGLRGLAPTGGADSRNRAGAGVANVASADPSRTWQALGIGPDEVQRLWLDGRVRALSASATSQARQAPAHPEAQRSPAQARQASARARVRPALRRLGAPRAWERGLTGEGVRLAVLDSGIDREHPDLAGSIAAARDFVGGGTGDALGHGTHIASVLAGSGKASDGRYRGVAPDARLLVGRVLDERGSGAESEVIAGMEWAIRRDADVVNVSIGNGGPSDGSDPMSVAANRLGDQALIVAAAGNSGPDPRTISAPGAAERALTVAAVRSDGTTADFSSRGPRRGDGLDKPDIAAPGVNVVGARASGTSAGPPVGRHYVRLTGTSMAVPYVAGAAAILVQAQPDATPRQLKRSLMAAAHPQPAPPREQGDGQLDIARLVNRMDLSSGRRAHRNRQYS